MTKMKIHGETNNILYYHTMLLRRIFVVIFISSLYASHQYRVLKTSILHFLPQLKAHHIIVIDEKTAIDFTPLDHDHIKTPIHLFLGKTIPAGVRIRDIGDIQDPGKNLSILTLDSRLSHIIQEWNKTDMNLYTHNCQHFSGFFVRKLRDPFSAFEI